MKNLINHYHAVHIYFNNILISSSRGSSRQRDWTCISYVSCIDRHILFYFFFPFIFITLRLITLQHCSGFCHTLTWISHGFTCVPHPNPPSHLPLHPIPLGLPSAPGASTCLMHTKMVMITLYAKQDRHILYHWCYLGNPISFKTWPLFWSFFTILWYDYAMTNWSILLFIGFSLIYIWSEIFLYISISTNLITSPTDLAKNGVSEL